MMLEATQYTDSPTGKLRLRNPIITGNIYCMICWVWSVEETVVIFMETHMDAPTKPIMT